MKIAIIATALNIIGCTLNIIGGLTNCASLIFKAHGFVLIGFGFSLGALIKIIRWW